MKQQRITVAGFLVVDDKVLLIRRSQKESFLAGFYEMPGGKVDFGEEPATAIAREFFEETQIGVEAVRPYKVFTYITNDNSLQTVEIVYLVKTASDNREVILSNAHDKFVWLEHQQLAEIELSAEMKDNIKLGFKIYQQ